MLKSKTILITLTMFFLSVGLSSAEIYSWTDENGVTHYSDTQPAHISEWEEQGGAPQTQGQQNNQDERYKYDPELISEILNELEDSSDEDSEAGPSVELFVTSWCTYCHKAKAFFRSRGIEFTEYNIEKDEAAALRMASLTQSRAVPFVIINGSMIQGYSVGAYERALNK